MKKTLLIAAVLAVFTVSGCNATLPQESLPTPEDSSCITTEVTSTDESSADNTVSSEISKSEEPSIPPVQKEPEPTPSSTEQQSVSEGYSDNFSVDTESVTAFAKQIQSAVKEKDLENLANLTAYPLYIGFEDGGVSVETQEDLLAYDKDSLFTPELMESVENADENSLTPSNAGFVLSTENGAANIVFGVRDGKLAISAINY